MTFVTGFTTTSASNNAIGSFIYPSSDLNGRPSDTQIWIMPEPDIYK